MRAMLDAKTRGPARSWVLVAATIVLLMAALSPRPAQALGGHCYVVDVSRITASADQHRDPPSNGQRCETVESTDAAALYQALNLLNSIVPDPATIALAVATFAAAFFAWSMPRSVALRPIPDPPRLSSR